MNYEERKRMRIQAEMERMKSNDAATTTSSQGQSQSVEREQARIKFKSVEMHGTFKSKLISSMKLCAMINKIMKGVSPDYDGSRIQVSGNQVVCELFFAENPMVPGGEKQIKVIERRDIFMRNPANRNNVEYTIERYNKRNNTATQYELTTEGKEAFSEFVPNHFVVNREKGIIDWNRCISEEVEQTFNGQNKVFVKLQFDLFKFLAKVFGDRDASGSKFVYEVAAIKALDPMKLPNGNIVATKWMLNVLQLDEASVREAYEDAGLSPIQNTLNIVRI